MSLIKLFKKKIYMNLFTTPTHSQNFFIISKFRQFYKFDISETDAHNPQNALKLAEDFACKIYKVKRTHFLTNGSTSGIITAVLSCTHKKDTVLIWEKAHPCHKNAVLLAGCSPVFYKTEVDEEFGISKSVNLENLETLLYKHKPKVLIVTSPTYEGVVSDIRALKNLCEKTNTYLIVDEAHGALYPFSEELPESAVNIADFTVQSLHKTAGGLNPTAILHNNSSLDSDEAFRMIQTTSPSYPMLASIEANINFLNSKRGRKRITQIIENIKTLKRNCPNAKFFNGDVTKIVLKIQGLNGFELSEKLYKNFQIEDEKNNEKSVLLITGIGTDEKKIKKLESAIKKLSIV